MLLLSPADAERKGRMNVSSFAVGTIRPMPSQPVGQFHPPAQSPQGAPPCRADCLFGHAELVTDLRERRSGLHSVGDNLALRFGKPAKDVGQSIQFLAALHFFG